jgi:hypothetical protein
MKVSGVFRNAKSFRDVPAGGVIFEEGAGGAEMFGIVAGEAELRLPNGAVHRLAPETHSVRWRSLMAHREARRLSR